LSKKYIIVNFVRHREHTRLYYKANTVDIIDGGGKSPFILKTISSR